MASLNHNFSNSANGFSNWFTYNPANQITQLGMDNNLFRYQGNNNRSGSYIPNGLNQYTHIAGQPLDYDANGNLTNDGSLTYTYDLENRLRSTNGAATSSFKYDPLGRLHEVTVNGTTTSFLYDGDALVAEYNKAGSLTRRYMHGDQVDEPWIAKYYISNTITTRYLHSDHQGSIVAQTDSSGSVLHRLTYDTYGIPGGSNLDRFGYTGQIWFKELGLFHYKARMYHPKLGRFLQTDPIFYADNMNMYAYVGNDPVNATDPTGTQCFAMTHGMGSVCAGPGLALSAEAEKNNPQNQKQIANAGIEAGKAQLKGFAVGAAAGLITGGAIDCGASGVCTALAAATLTVGSRTQTIDAPLKSSHATLAKDSKELFNFSKKASSHMDNPGRAVPVQTLQDAIKSSKGLSDSRGSEALMYRTTMDKNGTTYNLEVLYHQESNSIWHFKYFP